MSSVNPARYLAIKIPKSDIGLVKSSSIVPVLLSSANDFIVIAGIRTRKITGERLKKGMRSASEPSKRFVLYAKIQ
jgi:hypothetical protein